MRNQVIAATNRIDTLDPALLRSGRLDRKIEFPLPNEEARGRIMEIHSRKMQVSKKVNYGELARSTDEFNGAQLKAVCVEAGMIALREGSKVIGHEHFLSGVLEVQSKKKNDQVSSGHRGQPRRRARGRCADWRDLCGRSSTLLERAGPGVFGGCGVAVGCVDVLATMLRLLCTILWRRTVREG